jgi:two-component system response regulator NreC
MNTLSLMHRLRGWVAHHNREESGFVFDEELHHSLLELAGRESRPVNEVATEMLMFGLADRLANEEYYWCWRLLTTREQEVVSYVCRGYSCRQIAGLLVVSPETVKSHTRNAMRKFKLRDKTQLRKVLTGWKFGEFQSTE